MSGGNTAEAIESGLEALRRASNNPFRAYSTGNAGPDAATTRIKSNILCPVQHNAKFKLSRSSTFFTTGSCFAREVETALEGLGLSLSASDEVFSYDWFNPGHSRLPSKTSGPGALVTRPRSPFNRYCTHSMLYDIERVLEDKHGFESTVVPIEAGKKIWDPQLKNLVQGDMDFTLKMRGILDRIIKSITNADVVIMTLGMTETWIDSETGAILPTPPHPLYIKKFPQRFSYFVADYDSVASTLTSIIQKIGAHCPKSPRVVVTVSPIPMGSTFTDKDVIVANSYSKSTLVSAAQATARKYAHVDYFPSYEIVMSSSREIWHDDYVHIREEYVAQIMQKFIDCYLAG